MSDTKMRLLVLHGPNLNMLGRRERSIYGATTLDDIDIEIKQVAKSLDMVADTFQSNHEGDLIGRLHGAMGTYRAIIINPAAYTHTSVAIRDALLILDMPTIEVHLSNIYRREAFRHKSLIADIVTARISGFGKEGYLMAIRAVAAMLAKSNQPLSSGLAV